MKSSLALRGVLVVGVVGAAAWSCGGGVGSNATFGAAGSGGEITGASGSSSSGAGGMGGTASSSSGTASTSSGAGGMGGAVSSSSGAATSSSGTATTSSSSTSSSTSASSSTSTTSSSSGSTMFVPKTVFTILLENHDYNEIVGSANAPYINSLIAKYGLATNYMDSGTHPSLPNYLYLISGDTQYPSLGFIEYDPTIFPFPVSGDNLGHQLTVAGVPWRSYQESAGSACKTSSAGNYACRHDPFLYFSNIQNGANNLCASTNVDYTQFAADLAAGTYRYMWITPNLLSDGHDPSNDPVTGLKQSDAWLATEVPKILASSVFQSGGVLFITWDEAEGRNGDSGDQVPMIVVTPGIKTPGYKTSVAYSHASYLATVEDIFGLPRLGAAVGKASMKEFWQ